MNGADWAIVIVLTLSSVISLARGFIKEAFSLVIWLIALICANLFSHRLEEFLVNAISTPSLRAMAAFLLVFISVLLAGALISFLIGLIVKATGLSGTDRLLGMVFGFTRGLLLVMIFLIYVPNYVPVTKDSWFQQSKLIPYFSPYQARVQSGINGITDWVVSLLRKSDATSV